MLRVLVVFTLAIGSVCAGPLFLQEWLSRFLRGAISDQERATAARAIEHLNSGEVERAQELADLLRNQRLAAGHPAFNRLQPRFSGARPIVVLDAASIANLHSLPGAELGVLRHAEDTWPSVFRIRIVSAPVKQFNRRVEYGMTNPEFGFGLTPPPLRPLIENFRAARSSVAFIGAGRDDARISEFRGRFEADDTSSFFYSDCRRLTGRDCPPEMIGAVMATAKMTLLYDTPEAEQSLYTLSEAATVGRLRSGEASLILITPDQIVGPVVKQATVLFVQTSTPE